MENYDLYYSGAYDIQSPLWALALGGAAYGGYRYYQSARAGLSRSVSNVGLGSLRARAATVRGSKVSPIDIFERDKGLLTTPPPVSGGLRFPAGSIQGDLRSNMWGNSAAEYHRLVANRRKLVDTLKGGKFGFLDIETYYDPNVPSYKGTLGIHDVSLRIPKLSDLNHTALKLENQQALDLFRSGGIPEENILNKQQLLQVYGRLKAAEKLGIPIVEHSIEGGFDVPAINKVLRDLGYAGANPSVISTAHLSQFLLPNVAAGQGPHTLENLMRHMVESSYKEQHVARSDRADLERFFNEVLIKAPAKREESWNKAWSRLAQNRQAVVQKQQAANPIYLWAQSSLRTRLDKRYGSREYDINRRMIYRLEDIVERGGEWEVRMRDMFGFYKGKEDRTLRGGWKSEQEARAFLEGSMQPFEYLHWVRNIKPGQLGDVPAYSAEELSRMVLEGGNAYKPLWNRERLWGRLKEAQGKGAAADQIIAGVKGLYGGTASLANYDDTWYLESYLARERELGVHKFMLGLAEELPAGKAARAIRYAFSQLEEAFPSIYTNERNKEKKLVLGGAGRRELRRYAKSIGRPVFGGVAELPPHEQRRGITKTNFPELVGRVGAKQDVASFLNNLGQEIRAGKVGEVEQGLITPLSGFAEFGTPNVRVTTGGSNLAPIYEEIVGRLKTVAPEVRVLQDETNQVIHFLFDRSKEDIEKSLALLAEGEAATVYHFSVPYQERGIIKTGGILSQKFGDKEVNRTAPYWLIPEKRLGTWGRTFGQYGQIGRTLVGKNPENVRRLLTASEVVGIDVAKAIGKISKELESGKSYEEIQRSITRLVSKATQGALGKYSQRDIVLGKAPAVPVGVRLTGAQELSKENVIVSRAIPGFNKMMPHEKEMALAALFEDVNNDLHMPVGSGYTKAKFSLRNPKDVGLFGEFRALKRKKQDLNLGEIIGYEDILRNTEESWRTGVQYGARDIETGLAAADLGRTILADVKFDTTAKTWGGGAYVAEDFAELVKGVRMPSEGGYTSVRLLPGAQITSRAAKMTVSANVSRAMLDGADMMIHDEMNRHLEGSALLESIFYTARRRGNIAADAEIKNYTREQLLSLFESNYTGPWNRTMTMPVGFRPQLPFGMAKEVPRVKFRAEELELMEAQGLTKYVESLRQFNASERTMEAQEAVQVADAYAQITGAGSVRNIEGRYSLTSLSEFKGLKFDSSTMNEAEYAQFLRENQGVLEKMRVAQRVRLPSDFGGEFLLPAFSASRSSGKYVVDRSTAAAMRLLGGGLQHMEAQTPENIENLYKLKVGYKEALEKDLFTSKGKLAKLGKAVAPSRSSFWGELKMATEGGFGEPIMSGFEVKVTPHRFAQLTETTEEAALKEGQEAWGIFHAHPSIQRIGTVHMPTPVRIVPDPGIYKSDPAIQRLWEEMGKLSSGNQKLGGLLGQDINLERAWRAGEKGFLSGQLREPIARDFEERVSRLSQNIYTSADMMVAAARDQDTDPGMLAIAQDAEAVEQIKVAHSKLIASDAPHTERLSQLMAEELGKARAYKGLDVLAQKSGMAASEISKMDPIQVLALRMRYPDLLSGEFQEEAARRARSAEFSIGPLHMLTQQLMEKANMAEAGHFRSLELFQQVKQQGGLEALKHTIDTPIWHETVQALKGRDTEKALGLLKEMGVTTETDVLGEAMRLLQDTRLTKDERLVISRYPDLSRAPEAFREMLSKGGSSTSATLREAMSAIGIDVAERKTPISTGKTLQNLWSSIPKEGKVVGATLGLLYLASSLLTKGDTIRPVGGMPLSDQAPTGSGEFLPSVKRPENIVRGDFTEPYNSFESVVVNVRGRDTRGMGGEQIAAHATQAIQEGAGSHMSVSTNIRDSRRGTREAATQAINDSLKGRLV